MSILRSLFLNTAAFLPGPNDPPGGGDATGNQQQQEPEGGDNDAGDDTGAEGGQDAGGAEGAAAEGADAEADDDDVGADDADDEEDELAGLTPEQREKVEARIARETNWRDKQLARLNARKRSAEEDARAARTIAEGGARSEENLTPTQVEERARVLASQMSAQDRYDADANAAFVKGSEVYDKGWKAALDRLPNLGGVDLPDMQDILATEKPHVVLYLLSDPETYERVMALPPARRRTEFVRLSLKDEPKPKKKLEESKRPGGGPPPVKPLNNGRKVAAQSVNLYDDKVDDDAWYRARNETRRKKFSTHA